jgi:2-polyprenyl-6-methoxyphenol hydroxylase-like FAD-dependent oxidoreductase
MNKTDVLIIGAGPTGLFCAPILAQASIAITASGIIGI